MNTQLLFLFIKSHNAPYLSQTTHLKTLKSFFYLNNKLFKKSFYKFFKKIFSQQLGIMSLNLTKSFLFSIFNDLNVFLHKNYPATNLEAQTFSLYTIKYTQPIILVSYAFHKQTYNTLMLYILFFLTQVYATTQNSFKLNYSFMLHTPNLNLYPFLNFFYFKLNHF